VSKGDSAKGTATVAAATAGVALVATGVLSYFSYKQSGEIGPFRF
jgi:L-serine deaminase